MEFEIMKKDYIYAIYEFDKKTGRLSRRIELPDCDPDIVREQFAPNEDLEPYISDSHPVLSYQQALLIDPSLSERALNFSRFDYDLQANMKS